MPGSRAQATAGPAARGREPAPARRQAPARETPNDPAATSEHARAGAATRRDEAAQERRADDAPGSRREFAELLADQARPEPAPAARPAASEAVAAEPAAADALPERLLALLTGTWPPAAAAEAAQAQTGTARGPATLPALPHPAHATDPLMAPTVASPAQAAALTGTALAPAAAAPGIAMPADGAASAAPAAGIELPAAATVALAATPAGDAVESFAALAKLAADALGASHESSASPARDSDFTAAPDPYAIAGPAPLAGGARAPAPAPGAVLNLPASPEAGFDDGFGTRIAWMAEQRMGHAQIRLNPEHVGPIDVRVHLDGDRVAAEFHSAHAEVRQAIEASLPRLRELLGQHGLQLGQADVGQHQAGAGKPAPAIPGNEPGNGPGRDPLPQVAAPRSRGLLDEYA